jgi:8-oxo-dGTP pyrophosphatase MutT (NUDIX family)
MRESRVGADVASTPDRSEMPIDASLELLRTALARRPALGLDRNAGHVEAAVALILRAREDLEVLLIKRAERASDPWSGHMALPGGRRAAEDADLVATAFRESREEVGIDPGATGSLLGALDDVAPASRRLPAIVISPFVAAVPSFTEAVPDGREVQDAVWVPLGALRDEAAVSEVLIEISGGQRAFPSLRFRHYEIWGLTHRILTQFLELAQDAGL